MSKHNQDLGRWGEDLALKFLKKKKYNFITKNYRTPFGEIDIICKDKETLVFIEVKTSSTDFYGLPVERVNHNKQLNLIRSALTYLKAHDNTDVDARFDVVGIRQLEGGHHIQHIENAFETPF